MTQAKFKYWNHNLRLLLNYSIHYFFILNKNNFDPSSFALVFKFVPFYFIPNFHRVLTWKKAKFNHVQNQKFERKTEWFINPIMSQMRLECEFFSKTIGLPWISFTRMFLFLVSVLKHFVSRWWKVLITVDYKIILKF